MHHGKWNHEKRETYTGNAAAMREAVVKCVNLITEFGNAEIVKTPLEVIVDIEAILKAALAAPARNCDLYDGHEAWMEWQHYCADMYPRTDMLGFSAWLLATSKEGATDGSK